MESITKARIAPEEAAKAAAAVLGQELPTATELKEGFFNAAFRLDFPDGERAVLKAAPHPDVPVLGYEKDLMRVEVEAMTLARQQTSAPIPKVLAYDASKAHLDHELMIMEFLPGSPYHLVREEATQEQRDKVDEQVGGMLRQMNEIRGDRFGLYANPQAAEWKAAIGSAWEMLLEDGRSADIDLPYEELEALIQNGLGPLEQVQEPRFVHWDIWAGNIFVDVETFEVTGIIDFERAWWGDPVFEANFIEPSTAFLRGYGSADFLDGWRARRCLYNAYLGSVMLVEHVYRRYPEPEPATEWGRALMWEALAALRA